MTTLNLQVAASSDDAFESAAAAMTLTGLTIPLAAAGQWGGLRFNNVTIPQGATINTATLQIYINSTATDNVQADFYCQAADDAGTFTTGAGDISGRTRTTAKVSVAANNVGTGWYSITGMASVVEEVTNRGGWPSGNDLVVIIDPATGVDLQFRTWDHDTSLAAKLDIDYTAASTGQPTIARARLVPGVGRPHGQQGW